MWWSRNHHIERGCETSDLFPASDTSTHPRGSRCCIPKGASPSEVWGSAKMITMTDIDDDSDHGDQGRLNRMTGLEWVRKRRIQIIQPAMHAQEEQEQVLMPQEEESRQEEVHPMVIQVMAVQLHVHHLQTQPRHNRQEEQSSPVAIQHRQQCPTPPPATPPDSTLWILGHHWTGQGNLCPNYHYLQTTRTAASWVCSRCSKFGMTGPHLPSPLGEEMLKGIGLLILEPARIRHGQCLQSTPAQQAALEPAYILGDRKHIPDAANAVESVLCTELKSLWLKRVCDMATVPLSLLFGTSLSYLQLSMM